MPKAQKPAAKTTKVPSASARPKVKVSANLKENSLPRLSTSTRPTVDSKPLRTQPSSSNGAKDAETAALIANLRGQLFFLNLSMNIAYFVSAEIDQLKKLQAAKPEKKLDEIPRPTTITSLQDAMGLAEDRKLYFFCRVRLFLSPL
jgi:hypothetical protein